jgi:hypothetical protein
MAKMTDDDLLAVLRSEEEQASSYTTGQLAAERAQSYAEYMRQPYGNEEEGRSSVVSSDVLDTIEGMLPDLIDVFVSSDKAVQFDPTSEEDEEGARQATEACNYVFYRQNNGFLTLYTAAKDALLLKTGGVKWVWEEKRQATFTTYRGVDEMQLAVFLMTHPKATVEEKEEVEPTDEELAQHQQMAAEYAAMGQIAPELPKRYNLKIKTVETKGKVRLYNIPPEELLISRRHNSILIDECSYVAHVTKRTLSDITEMGYDVTEDDVKAASDESISMDRLLREDGDTDGLSYRGNLIQDRNDSAMVEGWLKEEYVLVDFDGDGIAERRCIMRLGEKILSNTEVSHVPIAAWTPYILTHRFHGMSVAEFVSDIQRIKTEIIRQSLDNLYFANNQRVRVLTDSQGNPLANIDDLLNSRPGGIVRESQAGAVQPFEQPWIGATVLPMMELMDVSKENRTGFTRYSQGLDADSLNKTKGGMQMIMNASQKRMKLMARIMAECLVAPMFKGIFKTLNDYCMEKLAFRLRNEYVAYDPQEWRDGYDMVINVGLGTGDKEQNLIYLNHIEMAQEKAIAGGGLGSLVTPKQLYNLQARKVEAAGFKNAGEFFTDPGDEMPPQKEPQPSPDTMVLAKTEVDKARIKADNDFKIAQMKLREEMKLKYKELGLEYEIHIDNTLLKQQEIDNKASQPQHPFPNFPAY